MRPINRKEKSVLSTQPLSLTMWNSQIVERKSTHTHTEFNMAQFTKNKKTKAVMSTDDKKNVISTTPKGKKFKNDVVGVQRVGVASIKSASSVGRSRGSSGTMVTKPN